MFINTYTIVLPLSYKAKYLQPLLYVLHFSIFLDTMFLPGTTWLFHPLFYPLDPFVLLNTTFLPGTTLILHPLGIWKKRNSLLLLYTLSIDDYFYLRAVLIFCVNVSLKLNTTLCYWLSAIIFYNWYSSFWFLFIRKYLCF